MDQLEEEEMGELLDLIAVGEAVVVNDVAVVPGLLGDLLGGHAKFMLESEMRC